MCFLAEDRAAAQRLAVSYPHLYFLLPDGVCYHGQTVTGGKKSGAGPLAMKREARELDREVEGPPGVGSTKCWHGWTGCTQEIIALEAELERLRALQQSREKDRVALDHEMRKLGEDLSRDQLARLGGAPGVGAPAPRCRKVGRSAQNAIAPP